MPKNPLLEQLSDKVQLGRIKDVVELIHRCLDQGISAQSILDDGLLHGLDELSVRFRNSEIFIAELLQASKAMKVGLAVIKDQLALQNVRLHGKAIIATVEGDLHDLGKSLVKLMLEGTGMDVVDLGADVSAERIVKTVAELKPDILALSSLLTTTMENQRKVMEALKSTGLRDKVKVIVGGAPITMGYCHSIEADGYAENAAGAVELVRNLLPRNVPINAVAPAYKQSYPKG
ncbi:MAG: corrinoid protein [Actinomycetia bacterium]|nr:corrinoid protein [Actinomycetes bacterium]